MERPRAARGGAPRAGRAGSDARGTRRRPRGPALDRLVAAVDSLSTDAQASLALTLLLPLSPANDGERMREVGTALAAEPAAIVRSFCVADARDGAHSVPRRARRELVLGRRCDECEGALSAGDRRARRRAAGVAGERR